MQKAWRFFRPFQKYKWLDFARMEGIIFSVKEGNTVKVRRD